MADDRKTVYVNDRPISIFLWAEVQHCVNAYDSDLYLKVRKGEAEIVDGNGDRIGWGGFAGNGQHIYVRLLDSKTHQQIAKLTQLEAQSSKHITMEAAELLIQDAMWVIANIK